MGGMYPETGGNTETVKRDLLGSVRIPVLSASETLVVGGFPSGKIDKNSSANAGDTGLIPGRGRFHMPWGN